MGSANLFMHRMMTHKSASGRGIIASMHQKAANVAIVALEGLTLFEFGVAMDVFGFDRSAAYGVPWYRVTACSLGGRAVRTDSGLSLGRLAGLGSLRTADTVIVAPTETVNPPPRRLLSELQAAHRRGARIVSLCSSAAVLAAAGLLDGRRATTHWEECAALAAGYPLVRVDPGVLYVDDEDILTSAGSAACIDLCLHIVRSDYGSEIAARLARELVVPPFREGGQAQFIETPLPRLDPSDPFLEVLAWAQGHLADPITISELARRAAMSQRNFARRFLESFGITPYQWILRQRLQLARRLLETSDLSIDAVADASGFATAANLRARFTEDLQTTPSAYRRIFRGELEQTAAA
jgi:AraC family transcriptional regulator, transcriptional activator FtrA